MSVKVNADGLASEVIKAMEEYQDTSFNTLKAAVDATAKKTVKNLNRTSPKRTGKYAKDWAQKEDKKKSRGLSYTRIVYNRRHYRITHLLEFGHRKVNGGAVSARPHIAKAEQEAVDELIKNLKENL